MSHAFESKANPFPGLRPFRSDEHHLFFGREDQTTALLQLLREHRFLAVVGTSGSGKSSLVRAGMIAELHGGTMTHAGSSWEVMILRPGGNPIANMTRAMLEADLYDIEDPSAFPRLQATLSRSRFGLVEAVKQSDVFEPGTNLLVVVDQFEELFRFRQQGVDSEEMASAFVNLLLTASEQAECPIYVTITMRSDYLGDCSEIPGLAEAVNRGEYLIPRLQRDQKRDAIEKPIGVGGAQISSMLVQRLLNDVGDDPDQLPVLQHALMRMWDVWAAEGNQDRPIDVSDFEATGGLNSAISNHADEIFDSLPDDQHRTICEKIFETLTEKGDDNRGIRRPTRLEKLERIANAERKSVTTILDAFRRSGVTFLMPGMDVELTDQTVIDLSHESLMRGWQRLRAWVEDEAQSARIFRRLLDTAKLWGDGKAGLFRDPDLQIALTWREAEAPNEVWAEQYGGDYQTAIEFLEASSADAIAEEQAKEEARQHELEQAQMLAQAEREKAESQRRSAKRLQYVVGGLAVVVVFAIGATITAMNALRLAEERRSSALVSEEAAKKSATAAAAEAERASQQEALAKAQAERAAQQEIAAQKARDDAEDNLTRARTAIDGFLVNVSESKLLSTPGLQPLRVELLAEASKFYEDFLENNPDNTELQAGLADSFYRVGFVQGDLGNSVEAKEALKKSIELWEAALQTHPGDESMMHGLANSNFRWSVVHFVQTAGNAEGVPYSLEAARLWKRLSDEYPENAEYRKELARAYNIYSLHNKADRNAAFLAYRKSLEIRLELLKDHPDDPVVLHGLGESFNNLGNMLPYGEQRLELLQRSVEFNKIVTQLDPQNVEYANDLCVGYSVTSRSFERLNRRAEAQEQRVLGARFALDFIRKNPAVPQLRDQLHRFLVELQSTAIEPTLAEDYTEVFRGAAQLLQSLPAETPKEVGEVAAAKMLYMNHIRNIARLEERELTGQERTEVQQLLETSGLIATTESAPDDTPTELTPLQLQKDRATGLLAISTLDQTYQRPAQSRVAFNQAYNILNTLAAEHPEDNELQLQLAQMQFQVADQLWNDGRLAEAKQIYESHIDQLINQSSESPEDDALARKVWNVQRDYAYKLWEMGLYEETARQLSRAMQYYRAPERVHGGDIQTISLLEPLKLLLTDQVEEYRKQRSQVLTEYQSKTFNEVASRLIRLSAILPEVVEIPEQLVVSTSEAKHSWHPYAYGLHLYRTGEYEKGLEILKPARASKDHLQDIPVADFVIAMSEFQLGNVDEAKRLYDQLAAQNPGQVALWTHEAFNLLNVDWYVLRKEACQLIYGDEYSIDERMRRGQAYAQLGDAEKSAAEFSVVVENLKDYPRGHALYAQALATLGRTDEALTILEKTGQLAEQQLDDLLTDVMFFWVPYADACARLDDQEQALAAYRRAFAGQTYYVMRSPQDGPTFRDWIALNETLAKQYEAANQPAQSATAREELLAWQTILATSSTLDDAENLLKTAEPVSIEEQLASVNRLMESYGNTSTEDDYVSALLTAHLLAKRWQLTATDRNDLRRASEIYENVLFTRNYETDHELIAESLAEILPEAEQPDWVVVEPTKITAENGTTLTLQPDHSILASGPVPESEDYTITFPLTVSGAKFIRLEALPDPSLPNGGASRDGNGHFYLSELLVTSSDSGKADDSHSANLRITDATASYQWVEGSRNYPIQNAFDGKPGAWSVWPRVKEKQMAAFEIPDLRNVPVQSQLTIHLSSDWGQASLGRFRLAVTSNTRAFEIARMQNSNAPGVAGSQFAEFRSAWEKLAVTYYLLEDQQKLDTLLAAHPEGAAGIGVYFANKSDWQEALDWYNQAITEETKDDTLFARRAEVHEKLGNGTMALDDYRSAYEVQKTKGRGYKGISYLLRRFDRLRSLNRFEDIIADMTKLMDDTSVSADALSKRAIAYDALRDWEKARRDHDNAIEKSLSSGESWGNMYLKRRAVHHIQQGHWKEAAADYAEAAKQAKPPGEVNGWNFSRDQALINLVAGDIESYQAAAAEMQQRLGDNPSNDQRYWWTMTFMAGPGMITQENLDRLLAASQSLEEWHHPRMQAALQFRAGQIEEAADGFKDATGGLDYPYLATMAFRQTGAFDLARETLEKVNQELQAESEKNPKSLLPRPLNWPASTVILALKREAENLEARVEELEQMLATEPNDADRYLTRGKLLQEFKRNEEALADFSKGIELDPDLVELRLARARIYEQLKQPEAASTDFRQALKLKPDDESIASALVNSFIASGVSVAELSENPWEQLAATYYQLENDDELDAILASHPASAAGVGQVLADQSDWQNALTWYDKAITPESGDATLFARRAEVHQQLQNDDAASADRTRASELQPDLAETYFELYQQLERWSDAADYGQLFLKQKLGDSQVWLRVAPVLFLADRDDEYEKHCAAMMQRFSGTDRIFEMHRLCYACLLKPDAVDASLLPGGGILNKLKNSAPNNSSQNSRSDAQWNWTAIGFFTYRNNQPELALQYLEEAEKQNANDSVHAMTLGISAMAYMDLDQPVAAQLALDDLAEFNARNRYRRNGNHTRLIPRILYREASEKLRHLRIEELNELMASEPDDPEGFLKRGRLLAEFERDEEALADFNSGIELNPESIDLRLARVELSEKLGQSNFAVEDLEQILQITDSQRETAQAEFEAQEAKWSVLVPSKISSDAAEEFEIQEDGSIFVTGPNPDRAIYRLHFPVETPGITALRLETIPDSRLHGGAGRSNQGNFHVSEASIHIEDDSDVELKPVEIGTVKAGFIPNQTTVAANMIDGSPTTMWDTYPRITDSHKAIFSFKDSVESEGEMVVTIDSGIQQYKQHGLGSFRISATSEEFNLDAEFSGPAQQLAALKEKSTEIATSLGKLLFKQSQPESTWTTIEPLKIETTGATLQKLEDGSLLASPTTGAEDDHFTFTIPNIPNLAALRLELIPDESLGGGVGHHESGNAQVREVQLFQSAENGMLAPIPLTDGTATFAWNSAEVENAIDGRTTSTTWHVFSRTKERHEAVFRIDSSVISQSDQPMVIKIYHHPNVSLGRFRFSYSTSPGQFNSVKNRHAWNLLEDPRGKLAIAWHVQGEPEKVEEVLSAFPGTLTVFGDFAVAVKDWTAAIDAFSQQIETDATNPVLLEKRANAYLSSEQWELALKDWQRVVELQPDKIVTALNAFRNRGRWEEAAGFAIPAVELEPSNSLRWLAVATAFLAAERTDDYAAFCQWLLEQPLDDVNAAERSAKLCLLLPDVVKVEDLPIEQIAQTMDNGTAPESFLAWGWATRSLAAYRSGDFEQSVDCFDRLGESEPFVQTRMLGLVIVAMSYHGQEKFQEAQAALSEAEEIMEKLLQVASRKVHPDIMMPAILLKEAKAKIEGDL